MISKLDKEKLFKEYADIFAKMSVGILVEASNFTVSETTEFRGKLNEQNGYYKVLKNRVAIKAAKGSSFEEMTGNLTHVRALVYTFEDALATTKMLTQEVKKNKKIKLISGVYSFGERVQVLSPGEIVEMGNLPSREELIVKLLYIMNAPVTNFVRTLNEVPSSFVRALNAVAVNKAA